MLRNSFQITHFKRGPDRKFIKWFTVRVHANPKNTL